MEQLSSPAGAPRRLGSVGNIVCTTRRQMMKNFYRRKFSKSMAPGDKLCGATLVFYEKCNSFMQFFQCK